MPYIQTGSMFWMLGGGFPAEVCDSEDPDALYCGPNSEYPWLRPLDVSAFQEWRANGMSHDRQELLAAGWVEVGKPTETR